MQAWTSTVPQTIPASARDWSQSDDYWRGRGGLRLHQEASDIGCPTGNP